MKLSKEAQEKMKQIQAIEDRYGFMPFRMGITYLVDVGHKNIVDESVEEGVRQILAQGETDKSNGIRSFLAPELQCAILRCAGELAKFSIMTLFAYIKEHVHVD